MELEAIQGCNVIHQYTVGEKETVWAAMLKGLVGNEPTKRYYYEAVDEEGNTKFITENKTLVMSVAGRFGYNWREVNYTESWEEVKQEC